MQITEYQRVLTPDTWRFITDKHWRKQNLTQDIFLTQLHHLHNMTTYWLEIYLNVNLPRLLRYIQR